MSSIKNAYNSWAEQYDTNINKTRDLEHIAMQLILSNITFETCLEMGCGTGKNTNWLSNHCKQITSVDFSEEMLSKAKEKAYPIAVEFIQKDITTDWDVQHSYYDVVTFSLVLEHIENLNEVFKKAALHLKEKGFVYIGELHPFKQYTGSKARYETEQGEQVVTCYTHHLTEFTKAAIANGFSIKIIEEFFDDNDTNTIPRILSMLFQKN